MDRNLSKAELESQVQSSSADAPHAVVLRAALRGFAKIAEKQGSRKMLPMLDECVDFISSVARHNGGEIYGADVESVTVGFGLHSAKADANAEAAVRAAQQLLEGFERISNRWREDADAPVALSIGIHEGEVIASPGSGSKQSPSLVGDTVSIAARLAARARAGEAILSAPIRKALRDPIPEVEIKPLGGMSFADRSQRVDIYCIPRATRLELGELRREFMPH